MPVHWGTFSLAMHAWDQPAERLLELAPKTSATLLMPQLGEPVEPKHVEKVKPWWRGIDAVTTLAESIRETEVVIPKSVPWPLD